MIIKVLLVISVILLLLSLYKPSATTKLNPSDYYSEELQMCVKPPTNI